VVHLSVLNQAPASAYFADTLQAWEQGRFIRFHGLAQWLGWLWPFAVLGYVLLRVSGAERRSYNRCPMSSASAAPVSVLRAPHLLLPQQARERRGACCADHNAQAGLRPLQGSR
jgi:hypothetical protein